MRAKIVFDVLWLMTTCLRSVGQGVALQVDMPWPGAILPQPLTLRVYRRVSAALLRNDLVTLN